MSGPNDKNARGRLAGLALWAVLVMPLLAPAAQATPSITSATYDAATGGLTVSGVDFLPLTGAANDVVANKLRFTGEGGATYTLTDTANVDFASSVSFSMVLSATDRLAVALLLNKNGILSTGGTTYNLGAAEDWVAGADAADVVADLVGNQITVFNVGAPTVSGVSPGAGPSAGGTSVTIVGTNFTGATGVKFGATNATSIVVNSATLLTATSPAALAGAVHVTVTSSDGTSATSAADLFTYVGPPTISGINPNAGPTSGGTVVIVTGNNLAGATALRFGANNATSFTVDSPTQITATSPAAAAGVVGISVTTAGGTGFTGAPNQFTYGIAVSPSVAGGHGTIAPATQQILAAGQTTAFTLTPDADYGIAGVSGTCGGGFTDYHTFTTDAVNSDCTVVASFEPISQGASGAVPGGTATATVQGGTGACGFASAQFVTPGAIGGSLPPGVTPVQSGFQFSSNFCAAGAVLTITVNYPSPLPAGATLFKYGPPSPGGSSAWFALPGAALSLDRRSFTYTITDNGVGDTNPSAGYISDPVLPVIVAPIQVPSVNPWGQMLLAGLLALGAMLAMRRRKVGSMR